MYRGDTSDSGARGYPCNIRHGFRFISTQIPAALKPVNHMGLPLQAARQAGRRTISPVPAVII